jgi:hypothetical protein
MAYQDFYIFPVTEVLVEHRELITVAADDLTVINTDLNKIEDRLVGCEDANIDLGVEVSDLRERVRILELRVDAEDDEIKDLISTLAAKSIDDDTALRGELNDLATTVATENSALLERIVALEGLTSLQRNVQQDIEAWILSLAGPS